MTDRSISISNVRKLAHFGPSILAIVRRNSGDVSVIYAADEFVSVGFVYLSVSVSFVCSTLFNFNYQLTLFNFTKLLE